MPSSLLEATSCSPPSFDSQQNPLALQHDSDPFAAGQQRDDDCADNAGAATTITTTPNVNRIAQGTLEPTPPRTSVLRKLSPALAARTKLFDLEKRPVTKSPNRFAVVGKIPQDHIQSIDTSHQDLSVSIRVEKRGRAWSHSDRRRAPSSQTTSSITSYQDTLDETGNSPDTSPESIRYRASTKSVDGMEQWNNTLGVTQDETTDLDRYLRQASLGDDVPPPPPPKDSPSDNVAAAEDEGYFASMTPGLSRAESIFSFSKASFSGQLSQLTSINLPDATTLSANISAIPTASGAAIALRRAAGQIQIWIRKARDVLGGMNAEDDIEWAAAGKEGLDEVDQAMTKFGSLIGVYVSAIEELQSRPDAGSVNPNDLLAVVAQMEETLKSWTKTKDSLRELKTQVEIAMEWEELWNVVLGDVGQELETLSRLIFEMEEKRHKTMSMDSEEPTTGLDINELETIVEDSPSDAKRKATKRVNMLPVLPQGSPAGSPPTAASIDDSSLLALFARMQPLRASLDFLPMRLSMFQHRAEAIFPSACSELEDRRHKLEADYRKLETDAEALRRELGEDRWVLVFRNAGRQALKMCESIERSMAKVQEALDSGVHHSSPSALAKKVENFEVKKTHYGPAIDRVLAIIQKGVDERLTVNGEILRLLADSKARADSLNERMHAMEFLLEEINSGKNHQLRDSISSIITMDRSIASSSADTPGSSPASSVIMGPGGSVKDPSTPDSRRSSNVSRPTTSKRYSSIPQLTGLRPGVTPRASSQPLRGVSPSPAPSLSYNTPRPSSRVARPSATPLGSKPRWNGSVNTNSDFVIGHNHKSVSSTTTPGRSRIPSRSGSAMGSYSNIPLPSPLGKPSGVGSRSVTTPAGLMATNLRNARLNSASTSTLASDRSGTASPSPADAYNRLRPRPSSNNVSLGPRSNRMSLPARSSTRTPVPPPRLSNASSMTGSVAGSSIAGDEEEDGSVSPLQSRTRPRPGTATNNRRVSLLPQPTPKTASGRESSLGDRPRWR